MAPSQALFHSDCSIDGLDKVKKSAQVFTCPSLLCHTVQQDGMQSYLHLIWTFALNMSFVAAC